MLTADRIPARAACAHPWFPLFAAVVVAAWGAWIFGWVPWRPPAFAPLPAAEGTATPGSATIDGAPSAWRDDGVYGGTRPDARHRALATRGSYVGGDAGTGTHTTGWYRAAPEVVVLVMGYPAHAGNALTVEAETAEGRRVTVPFTGPNPGDRWTAWTVALPADATRLRLTGTDGTTTAQGWLALAEPYTPALAATFDGSGLARTLTTVALAWILVLGPGVLWHVGRRGAWLHVLWPGPLLLIAAGIATWGLGGWIAPGWLAGGLIAALLAGVTLGGWHLQVWRHVHGAPAVALLLSLLCVLGAAAKAAFSGGPEGELYGGGVSRTLEIGGHADSRIAYHTVQMVARHFGPHSPEANGYLEPWNFSSRGPLSGLAAAPIVLATGGKPPLPRPDGLPWTPWDRYGFASYRITMMALASLGLHAVVGLLLLLTDDRRARLGAGLVALAPFFWHELYFSWPKLITAAWVLGSFALLHQGRAVRAGLALGGAYLFHPLALLSTPFLGLWAGLQPGRSWGQRILAGVRFAAGLATVLVAWRLINAGHHSQDGFLSYFVMSEGGDATVTTWFTSRCSALLNAVVPLWPWLMSADDPSLTAIGLRSDRLTQFFLQYWGALPLAVGLTGFITLSAAFVRGARRARLVYLWALLGPLLFLLIYWGVSSTTLVRTAGHVLFLTGWVVLVWSAAEAIPGCVRSRWWLGLRALEVSAMMFVPALHHEGLKDDWWLNDLVCLALALGSVALVAVVVRRTTPTPGEAATKSTRETWSWRGFFQPREEGPAPADRHGPAWRRALGTVSGCLLVWIAHLRWPTPPDLGLDPSWQTVLHRSWLENWQWGPQLVFTAGPWGWVFTPIALPETLTGRLIFEVAGKLTLIVFAAWMLRTLPAGRRWGLAALAAGLAPIAPDLLPLLVLLATGYAMTTRVRPTAAEIIAAGGVLAFLALAKMTFAVLGWGLLAVALSRAAWAGRWREVALGAGAYAGALLGAWMLARQNPAHLPAHFSAGLEVARGYAAAMQQDGPPAVFVAGLATLGGLLLLLPGMMVGGRAAVRRHAPLALVLGGIGWVAWQQGFVRADGHTWTFFVVALGVALVVASTSRAILTAQGLITVAALSGYFLTDQETARRYVTSTFSRSIPMLRSLTDLGAVRRTFLAQWQAAQAGASLPEICARVGVEPVDVANYQQAIIAPNALTYRPRTVPQSYVSYTSHLAELNAAAVQRPDAPPWLLWHGGTVDYRYPTAEDPLAIATWLTRYTPIAQERGFHLWKRRSPALTSSPENVAPSPEGGALDTLPLPSPDSAPFIDQILPTGVVLMLPAPATRPHWVQIDWPLSLLGRLRAFFYRPPIPFIVVRDAQGAEHRLRFLTGTSGHPGFLLSPYLPEAEDFARFATDGTAQSWVTAFSVEPATPDQARYWRTPRVRLWSDSGLAPSITVLAPEPAAP